MVWAGCAVVGAGEAGHGHHGAAELPRPRPRHHLLLAVEAAEPQLRGLRVQARHAEADPGVTSHQQPQQWRLWF